MHCGVVSHSRLRLLNVVAHVRAIFHAFVSCGGPHKSSSWLWLSWLDFSFFRSSLDGVLFLSLDDVLADLLAEAALDADADSGSDFGSSFNIYMSINIPVYKYI